MMEVKYTTRMSAGLTIVVYANMDAYAVRDAIGDFLRGNFGAINVRSSITTMVTVSATIRTVYSPKEVADILMGFLQGLHVSREDTLVRLTPKHFDFEE